MELFEISVRLAVRMVDDCAPHDVRNAFKVGLDRLKEAVGVPPL